MQQEKKGIYKTVERRTREQVEAMLTSQESAKIVPALLSAAYYDPDWRWVQTQCLFYLTHDDLSVRRTAANCLGLLAVFHKRLDSDLVISALRRAAEDPDVRPWAEDSLEDIEHALGV